MIRDTLPTLDAGRRVLSTVRLLTPEGDLHPCCEMIEPEIGLQQLAAARNCDILLDEVTGIAEARSAMSMPKALLDIFMQLRRRNVRLRWTSPAFMRADASIRQVTQLVTVCNSYVKGPPPPPPPGEVDGDDVFPWPSKRLFRYRSFDASDIEKFEAAKLTGVGQHKVKVQVSEWWWRGTDSRAASSYSTRDAVTHLSTMDDSGYCLGCGGMRSRSKCSCASVHRRTPADAFLDYMDRRSTSIPDHRAAEVQTQERPEREDPDRLIFEG